MNTKFMLNRKVQLAFGSATLALGLLSYRNRVFLGAVVGLFGNCYPSKPVQVDTFASLVKSINDFWLTNVKLPQQLKSK